jgi:predicted adenylyl cyclase CyaB
MAVEIEAKMRVVSLSAVKDRLVAAGAKLVGEFLERNTFFDTEDRTLLAADEGLRLRLNQDLNTGTKVCIMTFKGPRQHGQLKSREEIQTTVGSYTDACAIIERMGYGRILSFEKRRDTWSLKGCEIELDTLPRIGCFVEIEGPKDEAILEVRDLLKLSDRPLVRASYVALLMNDLQEAGEVLREVVFPEGESTRRVTAGT